jgi:FHS family L-fucose permease-like MFS transporter
VWGIGRQLTDVMVGVFRHIFVVSNARSALLQTAYYGAYFTLAIPASFINRRLGYKTGVLTGLGVAASAGCFVPGE